MPIIIPSKNIYGEPKTNRIRKIGIDAIEFNEYSAQISSDLYKKAFIGSKSIDNFSVGSEKKYGEYSEDSYNYPLYTYYDQAVSYTRGNPYYCTVFLDVPVVSKRQIIEKLYAGKDTDGGYRIDVTFDGTLEKGWLSCDVNFDIGLGKGSSVSESFVETILGLNSVKRTIVSTENVSGFRPKEETTEYQVQSGSAKAESSVTVLDLARQESISQSPLGDSFYVTIKSLFCGHIIEQIGADRTIEVYHDGTEKIYASEQYGEYEIFTPKTANISINGDTIVLDLSEVVKKIGEGKNPFEVTGNELIQSTNFVEDSEGKMPYIEYYSQKIFGAYNTDKGASEITCSIFPVTLDDGTQSLIIPVGSSVIPMYMKPNGEDAPMFAKPDGTAIPCRVVGAEVYYDGATMQRLTIKEM